MIMLFMSLTLIAEKNKGETDPIETQNKPGPDKPKRKPIQKEPKGDIDYENPFKDAMDEIRESVNDTRKLFPTFS